MSDNLDIVSTVPMEELEERYAPQAAPGQARAVRERSLGKYAFGVLLLGGVLVAGLYGALKTLVNPSAILRVVQNPALSSIFTDPVRLGLVLLFCTIPVVIVRRRRSVHNRLTYV